MTPAQKRTLSRANLGYRISRAGGFGGRRNRGDPASIDGRTVDALLRRGALVNGVGFNTFVITDAGREIVGRFRKVWLE